VLLAGLPTPNDQTFCPVKGTSCYFWHTSRTTWSNARSSCINRGGYLVSYQTFAEQLQVETYFNKTAMLETYWIGLYKSGSMYYWLGGGDAGTGVTTDANPYGASLTHAAPGAGYRCRAALFDISSNRLCSISLQGTSAGGS
jgi:hypothetical protein